MKQPKPFFRKFTGTWYVQVGKKQVNLGSDKRAAWAKYHEIMADRKSLAGICCPDFGNRVGNSVGRLP